MEGDFMKKLVVIFCVLAVCMMCIPVYGTLSNYSDTIPTFGTKVVATGSKTNTRTFYRNLTLDCDSAFNGWVEAYLNGKWTQVTDTQKFYANENVTINYNATPAAGLQVRFVISKYNGQVFGGQSVTGTVNFE